MIFPYVYRIEHALLYLLCQPLFEQRKCGNTLVLSAKENMKVDVMNNYTCPMHEDVKSDKPGKCPKCGTTLTKVKRNAKSKEQAH